MIRYAITLSYDGTHFTGWQVQPESRTVQGTLEAAFTKMAKAPITVMGSGRTDSGVHALGQVAHFDLDMNMTPQQIMLALRTRLPHNIGIIDIRPVHEDFHARYKAFQRDYQYHIARERTPFNRLYCSTFARKKILPDKIAECLPHFLGSHDFASFCKPNPDITNTVCDMNRLDFEEEEGGWVFHLSADRFLHNMVRRIVGCIITITNRGLSPAIIDELFEIKRSDQLLTPTAPPQGLFLTKVHYPKEFM